MRSSCEQKREMGRSSDYLRIAWMTDRVNESRTKAGDSTHTAARATPMKTAPNLGKRGAVEDGKARCEDERAVRAV